MAKKEEHEGGEKKKRKHLHQVRTVFSEDGKHAIHHHTYKAKAEDPHNEPERENAAVSSSPEDAGQHLEDMMAQNQQGGGGDEAGAEAQPDPAAAAAGAGAPAAGE